MSDPITIVTTVPAAVAVTLGNVGPQGPTGIGTRKFGILCEWGDALNDGVIQQGQQSRVRANGSGNISRLMVDTDVACNCQIDILVNGVSIFGVGSTKPFLVGASAYDTSVMTGIATAINEGDLVVAELETYSGTAKQLLLTAFISPTP